MLSADCRGLAGAGLSLVGVTCCLAAFILFSSPSSDRPEGDDGRWKGAWESCTIEMDGAAKKLSYLALSHPAPPFRVTSFLITYSEREATKLSLGTDHNFSTLLPPFQNICSKNFKARQTSYCSKPPHPSRHQKSFT